MSFTVVYENSFSEPLGTEFTIYSGVPKCCPQTLWAQSQVTVQGGFLTLKNTRQADGSYLSGGLSMAHAVVGGNQTYGRWQMRFRFDAGIGIKMVALLWPESGWPPEIDFAETSTSDAARMNLTGTLHYGSNQMIHESVPTDLTRWNTCRLDWTPGMLRFYLNGKQWGQILSLNVPSQPMHLAIQTEVGLDNGNGSPPDDSTPAEVDMQVDWLRISEYTP